MDGIGKFETDMVMQCLKQERLHHVPSWQSRWRGQTGEWFHNTIDDVRSSHVARTRNSSILESGCEKERRPCPNGLPPVCRTSILLDKSEMSTSTGKGSNMMLLERSLSGPATIGECSYKSQ